MRRPIVIALLSLGVLAGYGSGFAHVIHHARACSGWHHDHDRGDRDHDRNCDDARR